jgi:membrane-bound serine protease (ClpP class)
MDGSHRAISLPVIGGTATVAAGFILWTVTRFVGLRKKHPVSGTEQIIREKAVALDDFRKEHNIYRGHVRLSGERWKAESDNPVRQGDAVQVTGIDGLTVSVEAAGQCADRTHSNQQRNEEAV